jgi:hypothetical protein
VSFDCYCDYDAPEFYGSSVRRARRPHRYGCEECDQPIKAGQRYELVAGKWDGTFFTFKTCQGCLDLRTWVKNNVPCFCWAHGNIHDDMRTAIDDAYERAQGEVVGLNFGYLRRKIMVERGQEIRP